MAARLPRRRRLKVPAEPRPPLAVDMDGTLLATDLLMEGLVHGLSRRPWRTLAALPMLLKGRAGLKARIARIAADLDFALLPCNAALLGWLQAERASGRRLYLVTASDRAAAEAVARCFELFDGVMASDGRINLKGARKGEELRQRFPGGFTYAGDSFADLAVWRHARGIVFAGWKQAALARAVASGGVLEAAFPGPAPAWRDWQRVLGLWWWVASLPLVVILPLAGVRDWRVLLAASLCAGCVVSAAALWRRLLTVAGDRRAGDAKNPFASGRLPLAHGLGALAFCLALALLSGGFALWRAIFP